MIYKFKSKAAGDVIMLKPNGDHVLRIIGKEPGQPRHHHPGRAAGGHRRARGGDPPRGPCAAAAGGSREEGRRGDAADRRAGVAAAARLAAADDDEGGAGRPGRHRLGRLNGRRRRGDPRRRRASRRDRLERRHPYAGAARHAAQRHRPPAGRACRPGTRRRRHRGDLVERPAARARNRRGDRAAPSLEAGGPRLAVETDAGLRERHFGVFQGATYADIDARWPAEALRWRRREPAFAPDGGESLLDFHARCVGTAARLAALHAGRTVALVAHGGVMDCLHRAALGLDLQAVRTWQLGNAAINRLLFSGGRFGLVGWGDTRHLDDLEPIDESSAGARG